MSKSRSFDELSQPVDPTPREVLEKMDQGVPYSTGEVAGEFNTSRWTIQRRLEKLYKNDRINKKHHTSNRVSWWVPCSGDE